MTQSDISKTESFNFSEKIEKLAKEKGIPHIDAIILFCETNKLEIEVVSKLITKQLKTKIKHEAEKLNFLVKPKTKKIPIKKTGSK